MTNTSIDLRTFDLQAQFQRCVEWNDAKQWESLAMLYYQRGYLLNAAHCFERVEACRVVVVETEPTYATH